MNLSPTVDGTSTLFERLYGIRARVNHLRVSRSMDYALKVDKDQRTLASKEMVGWTVRFATRRKADCVLSVDGGTVYIWREVVADSTQAPVPASFQPVMTPPRGTGFLLLNRTRFWPGPCNPRDEAGLVGAGAPFHDVCSPLPNPGLQSATRTATPIFISSTIQTPAGCNMRAPHYFFRSPLIGKCLVRADGTLPNLPVVHAI